MKQLSELLRIRFPGYNPEFGSNKILFLLSWLMFYFFVNVFHLSQDIFKFSLWFLFWSVGCLGVCHLTSMYLWILAFLLLLLSSFIPLWSEKIVDMVFIFLNLLKLILWTNIWFTLKNILCLLEKNVYSTAVGWTFYNVC